MIKTTERYDTFSLLDQNRDVDLKHSKTKRLAEMMLEHGWLDAFPLMAKKGRGGKLLVVDGQHRLAVAREYGIPVKYVVEEQDVDVAKLNDTSKGWTLLDYANRYAKEGAQDYEILLHFCEKYGINVSAACELLGGSGSQVRNGTFKIKNLAQAQKCAESYLELGEVDKKYRKSYSLRALWGCFYVDYFDFDRLLAAAKTHTGLARSMADTDGYLTLFEEIYNHHKKDKKPLKFDAQNLARGRSCVKR